MVSHSSASDDSVSDDGEYCDICRQELLYPRYDRYNSNDSCFNCCKSICTECVGTGNGPSVCVECLKCMKCTDCGRVGDDVEMFCCFDCEDIVCASCSIRNDKPRCLNCAVYRPLRSLVRIRHALHRWLERARTRVYAPPNGTGYVKSMISLSSKSADHDELHKWKTKLECIHRELSREKEVRRTKENEKRIRMKTCSNFSCKKKRVRRCTFGHCSQHCTRDDCKRRKKRKAYQEKALASKKPAHGTPRV
uniref:Uncharacterized protein n=1 Tax=Mucochytrium quahogii TaxID=96639 RepID=A0A7S2RDQ1_9STRA|mmetsp:Transcript_25977/g.41956  ORF Transcript_25977/g.41956 Transcript_25977/m.41956 type:complete len:250 (+) Transcript_25977:98-847(+)